MTKQTFGRIDRDTGVQVHEHIMSLTAGPTWDHVVVAVSQPVHRLSTRLTGEVVRSSILWKRWRTR